LTKYKIGCILLTVVEVLLIFLTHTEVIAMATDKTFNVFGVSKLNGEYKVRFANDVMRIKVLAKHGHEDITLVDLEQSVSKYEGIKAIALMPEFATASYQSAITEYLTEKAPKAAPVAAPVKANAKKAPAKAAKAAKVSEDAPF
jgi:methylmalonyl-CoA mutase cobalamin-binding subunit